MRWLTLSLLLCGAATSPTSGRQAPSLVQETSDAYTWYGASLVGIGDVDGDGSGDLVVAAPVAPWSTEACEGVGIVRLHSGRTGRLLWERGGENMLGWELVRLGDVDTDGVDDVASLDQAPDGELELALISGCNGETLSSIRRRDLPETLGVLSIGAHFDGGVDVDGDGVGDLVVDVVLRAPGRIPGDPSQGVLLLSGRTGEALTAIRLRREVHELILLATPQGDIGPGVLVLTSKPLASRKESQVHVLSATFRQQGVLWESTQTVACSSPDLRACRLGDVDADGIEDVAVGVSRCCAGSGRVWILSGRDGTRIHEILPAEPSSEFSKGLAGTADVDGDGIAELLVTEHEGFFGNCGTSGGRVHLVSGASGALLWSRAEPSPDSRPEWEAFGASVAALDDVDGDATPDLAVGALEDLPGGWYPGAVHVLSGVNGHWLYSLP